MHMHWQYPCLCSLNTGLACFNKRTEIHPCMLAKNIKKGGKESTDVSHNSKIKINWAQNNEKLLHFKKYISLLFAKKIKIRSDAKQNKHEAHVGKGRQSMIPCGMIFSLSAGISCWKQMLNCVHPSC